MSVTQGVHPLEVMGDDEDGQSCAAPLVQDGDEQVARGRVEARHGFVEDEDARVGGEQPGEGDAAHLPAGEVVDAARRQGGVEADEFHGLGDDAVAFLAADGTLAVRRSGADARPMTGGGEDVGAHGGTLKLEARKLHGEGDVANAALHGAPAEGDATPRGDEQTREDARERRLTRTIVTGDKHCLAGVEDEADVAQDRLLPGGAEVVGVGDAVSPQVGGVDERGRTRHRRHSRRTGGGGTERIPGLVDEGSTLPRAAVGEDAPTTNRDDSVGARAFGGVVGDVDDGDAARGQGGEEVEHFGAAGPVDHSGGFIGDEQARRTRERAREREALKLPAGQRARVGIGEAREADALEQLLEVEAGNMLGAHTPGDIFGDTLSENKEFGALSHERDAADSSEDAATLTHARAGFGTCEEEGQGGLARAVMSDDDRKFRPLEAQRDTAQGGVVGARVSEVDVGEGQGQGGRGLGPITRVRRAGGCVQERVPARVEGDAAEDGAEEPPCGEDQEGYADEAGDGDPDPPPVDEPLAELMPRVDEAAGVGDVSNQLEEAVECLSDTFEAEGAQVGQHPERDARADAPDDAKAGGDAADGQPGGALLVEEADDEADEGGLEGAAGGGDAADGDGEEDRRGEGCDCGSGSQFEGDHREGDGRGDLEEELEDGGDRGDEAEGNGQARERAGGRHLNRGEAAGIARG